MRTTFALLLAVVGAAPAAGQPPEAPAPLKAPTDAELDALVADAAGRDPQAAPRAAEKLVALGPVAVPALTQGLWAEPSVRRACVRLLGSIGADARAAAPSLARLLAADDPEVQTAAARALVAVGAHSARPALAKRLEDKSAAVRLTAAEALVHLGEPAETVLPVLTKALASEQPGAADAAARVLGELGPEGAPAVPAISDRIATADAVLTARLAEALGRIGPAAKDAAAALRAKLAADRNAAPYRVPAAVALWRVARDPDAGPLLRAAIGAKEHAAAPAVLWRVDQSDETVAALEKRLEADDADDVLAAAAALGMRSKETVAALARLLKSNDRTARVEAASALYALGPDGAAAARDALGGIDRLGTTVQAVAAAYRLAPTPQAARALTDLLEGKVSAREAAEALKDLRPANPAVVVELLAALDHPDEQVRLACAVALWRIEKHAQALPAATKLLRSNDPPVRALAAADLGIEFGPDAKPAVPELVKRLFDPFAAVRSASAEALGRVGPGAKDAAPALLAVLGGDEPAFVHSAACEALGLIRPSEAEEVVAALKEKLAHPDPLVRVHAALALLRVAGDKSGAKEVEAGLSGRTHHARITAAEAAWLLDKDARAVPLLVRALEEGNLDGTGSENERYMAARALGRIGADARAAVPELVKLVSHRDYALASAARAALKVIDPDAAAKAGVK